MSKRGEKSERSEICDQSGVAWSMLSLVCKVPVAAVHFGVLGDFLVDYRVGVR